MFTDDDPVMLALRAIEKALGLIPPPPGWAEWFAYAATGEWA